MLELTDTNFDEELKENKIVVVDFFALWCGPCKAMAPIFEELSKEFKQVKFGKINVDEYTSIASRFRVMSIPTFIIFKDGKEVERIIGGNSKTTMKAKIELVLKK